MRIKSSLIAVVALAGCASTGTTTQFERTAIGPVADGIVCITNEAQDNGWEIVSSDDAGLIRAERGTNWMDAQIIPGTGAITATHHQIQLQIADTEPSRQLAEDVMSGCA